MSEDRDSPEATNEPDTETEEVLSEYDLNDSDFELDDFDQNQQLPNPVNQENVEHYSDDEDKENVNPSTIASNTTASQNSANRSFPFGNLN